jgi:hypothetical protein
VIEFRPEQHDTVLLCRISTIDESKLYATHALGRCEAAHVDEKITGKRQIWVLKLMSAFGSKTGHRSTFRCAYDDRAAYFIGVYVTGN